MINFLKMFFGRHELQQVSLQGNPRGGAPKLVSNHNSLSEEARREVINVLIEQWGEVKNNAAYCAILLSGTPVCVYRIQTLGVQERLLIEDLWVAQGWLGKIGARLFMTNGWMSFINSGIVQSVTIHDWHGKLRQSHLRKLHAQVNETSIVITGTKGV